MSKERKSWLPHPEAEIHPSMPRDLHERAKREADQEEQDDSLLEDFKDSEIECWCGARGKPSQLFERVRGTCGGLGYLNCYRGGDFCVCHNHGEVECFGCEECQADEGDCENEQ